MQYNFKTKNNSFAQNPNSLLTAASLCPFHPRIFFRSHISYKFIQRRTSYLVREYFLTGKLVFIQLLSMDFDIRVYFEGGTVAIFLIMLIIVIFLSCLCVCFCKTGKSPSRIEENKKKKKEKYLGE